MVRRKLQGYQDAFVKKHNRKIQYHEDIVPIEREYRMYKEVKQEIAAIEQQLRELAQEAFSHSPSG